MRVLTIVRGLPGSGKSTLADRIVTKTGRRCESDFYFMKGGEYVFDIAKLKDAHEWCQQEVRNSLQDTTCEDVVVSNTFTELWEMQPYLDMAEEFGAKVNVIECHGTFGSIRGVPEDTLQRLRSRWTSWVDMVIPRIKLSAWYKSMSEEGQEDMNVRIDKCIHKAWDAALEKEK